jgi:short-subunit dehydrogenase
VSVDLKPLDEQVIVITGASSGIGLRTARMAADRGTKLVLAARSEDALRELADEIERDGCDATYVVADVSDREDVREVAATARETYGGFDTWVNVAGAFLYGRLDETPIEEMREQFDTNVWGLLYGSLEAADHLEARGGAIINVGSVVSDVSIPLQGSYSASKHAVKGFTDALRTELEADDAPVSVTLIKPSQADTPYSRHAKNHMDEAATLPPPLYAPEAVARAILDAAERPQRDVTVGGAGKAMTALATVAPGLMDTALAELFLPLQQGDGPPRPDAENNIDGPTGDLEERGDYDRPVLERSLYTGLVERGSLTAVAVGLVIAVLYALSGSQNSS